MSSDGSKHDGSDGTTAPPEGDHSPHNGHQPKVHGEGEGRPMTEAEIRRIFSEADAYVRRRRQDREQAQRREGERDYAPLPPWFKRAIEGHAERYRKLMTPDAVALLDATWGERSGVLLADDPAGQAGYYRGVWHTLSVIRDCEDFNREPKDEAETQG